MNPYIKTAIYIVLIGILPGIISCTHTREAADKSGNESGTRVVRKKREDGTLSSVNQVDEMGRVHGFRVTYFEDGKTVHSKYAFSHGQRQGPSIRNYRNGQVFEHSNYQLGKKHGLSRKYRKDGSLLSECNFENDHVLPGLKEYDKDGRPVTSYPEVRFREYDHLASRNRVDLEMSCQSKVNGVRYYRLQKEQGKTSRVYLVSENNAASLQFYVKPGEILVEELSILAEIPTEFGNIYARELSYRLQLNNLKKE